MAHPASIELQKFYSSANGFKLTSLDYSTMHPAGGCHAGFDGKLGVATLGRRVGGYGFGATAPDVLNVNRTHFRAKGESMNACDHLVSVVLLPPACWLVPI